MFRGFDKRFAYQFQGGREGGWTPPWLQQDEEGWQGQRHGPWGHGGHRHHH